MANNLQVFHFLLLLNCLSVSFPLLFFLYTLIWYSLTLLLIYWFRGLFWVLDVFYRWDISVEKCLASSSDLNWGNRSLIGSSILSLRCFFIWRTNRLFPFFLNPWLVSLNGRWSSYILEDYVYCFKIRLPFCLQSSSW
jgi:hypothetical protein